MQRITSSGATGDAKFKETPAPATRLAAGWLNSVQEEIARVIEDAAGGAATLNPADTAQLLAAILTMIGRGTPALNSARAKVVHVIEAPTGGNEAYNAGDNAQLLDAMIAVAARAITFNVGEQSVQIGPLIIKVGATLGAYSEGQVYTAFGTAFPNACWGAIPIARNDSGNTNRDIWTQLRGAPTTAGFTTVLQLGGGGTSNSIDGFQWIALGY